MARTSIFTVDLGNWNIKTSKGDVFESRFLDVTDQALDGTEEIIEFENRKYMMVAGDWDKEFNKIEKNYMPNLLYGLVKGFVSDTLSINLSLGLPVEQLAQRIGYKERLEGKTFEFKYKDAAKKVTFEKIGIIAEGVSTLYTIPDRDKKDKNILLLDIGGYTCNVLDHRNMKTVEKQTLEYGVYDYYSDLKSALFAKGDRKSIADIAELIRKEKLEKLEKAKDINIEGLKDNLINRISNDLKEKFDLDLIDEILFTGGGSIVLETAILRKYPDAEFIKDRLFSNVEGNFNVVKAKWSE